MRMSIIKEILKRILPKTLILQYRMSKMLGYKVNIKEPSTFNEKIQWLKLNNKDKRLSIFADKIEVREFIKTKIGEEYLVPIHKIYNSYKEIKPENLPQSFVLKAAHGSGWNILCKDKTELDFSKLKQKVKKWGNSNYYWVGYEYAYKQIPHRFICEKLLLDEYNNIPMDYKIFCFNGMPTFIQVDLDRFTDHSRLFYDLDWEKMDMAIGYKPSKTNVLKPKKLDKMLEISSILSKGFNFVRIDLYNCDGSIYFGEITFYPGEGSEKFTPQELDKKYGDLLPIIK